MLLDRRAAKTLLVFFCLSISVVMFRYLTDGLDDSSFHYTSMKYFAGIDSIFDFYQGMMNRTLPIYRYDYSEYPLFGIFLYLISQTHILSLSSVIVCFITYYLLLSPVVDLYKKSILNNALFLLVFLSIFFLNNYRYTTSGMRYCLIVALLFYLFFKDSQRGFKQDKFLLLYLIPVLIHPSALIYTLLRFFYPIIKTSRLFISLPIILMFPIVILILPRVAMVTDLAIIDFISAKLLTYTKPDAFAELFNNRIYFKMYAGTFLSIIYIITYLNLVKSVTKVRKEFQSFVTITYYLSLLNLGMLPFYNLWDRHIFLLYPMVVLSFALLFLNPEVKINFSSKVVVLLYMFSCIFSILIGIYYNMNFNFGRLLDFTMLELVTSNIFEFLSNIPRII
ncbi:hypothetical protein HO539_01985 [Streptococcus suis]|nr:hypothetical protein [Streptococcus suis]